MPTLHIQNTSGDKQVDFDVKAIPQEVIDLFNDAMGQGCMAYQIGPDVKNKETLLDLTKVKEDTTKVVVRGPMAGG